MARIRGIVVRLTTSNAQEAGTDDAIYSGVFGTGAAGNFHST